jgi:hypothetical protein
MRDEFDFWTLFFRFISHDVMSNFYPATHQHFPHYLFSFARAPHTTHELFSRERDRERERDNNINNNTQ